MELYWELMVATGESRLSVRFIHGNNTSRALSIDIYVYSW
ncbi:hypothetical protein J2T12_000420 [Paenibacillus anaericanus]|nr:hypothetical protein [Paenibacillus anaericanus]